MTAPRPVGFDLDNTLIDSNPQVFGSFTALARESGRAIDLDAVQRRLGVKLEAELAFWFAPEEIELAAATYRRHYLTLIETTKALPGAIASLAAVRRSGARTLVITAKHGSTAAHCCQAAGLVADEIVAFVHGPEKAVVLRRVDAGCYVGDTPPDMDAARLAGVVGVGVPTGSFAADELSAAGATVTLGSLDDFPAWYEGFLASS